MTGTLIVLSISFLTLVVSFTAKKIVEKLHAVTLAILLHKNALEIQTFKLTTPREGLILAPHELAILSNLLRGYIVGPAAREVLDKVHMFGVQDNQEKVTVQ